MMLPRCLNGANVRLRTTQSLAMSLSLPSMASSLTAEPAISSTSSAIWRMPASSSVESLNDSAWMLSSAPGELLERLPVARAQRGVGELLDERQRLEEVVDGLLELDVRVPAAQLLGHLLARELELLELLDHPEMLDSGPLGVSVKPHTSAHAISLNSPTVASTFGRARRACRAAAARPWSSRARGTASPAGRRASRRRRTPPTCARAPRRGA